MPAVADNHQTKNVPVKHNSCTEAGHTAYTVCELCGKTWGYEETKPYGHKWSYVRTLTAATCIAEGKGLEQCDHCKAQQEKVLPIAPTAHNAITVPAKLNSCTEDGYNTYDKCTLCDKILSNNGVIPVTKAYGHKYEAVDWKVKPTCVAGGIMYKRCRIVRI